MDIKLEADNNLIIEVTNLMKQLGIPAHLHGYRYLREAIMISYEDEEVLTSITKFLYPDLAKKFKENCNKIERGIRNAIEISWNRANPEVIEEIFGKEVINEKRPTNTMYILAIIEDLKRRNK